MTTTLADVEAFIESAITDNASGQVTAARLRQALLMLTDALAGATTVETRTQSAALRSADMGKILRFASDVPVVCTVPTDAEAVIAVGKSVEIGQISGGALSVDARPGVVVETAAGTVFDRAYLFARLLKTGPNRWSLAFYGASSATLPSGGREQQTLTRIGDGLAWRDPLMLGASQRALLALIEGQSFGVQVKAFDDPGGDNLIAAWGDNLAYIQHQATAVPAGTPGAIDTGEIGDEADWVLIEPWANVAKYGVFNNASIIVSIMRRLLAESPGRLGGAIKANIGGTYIGEWTADPDFLPPSQGGTSADPQHTSNIDCRALADELIDRAKAQAGIDEIGLYFITIGQTNAIHGSHGLVKPGIKEMVRYRRARGDLAPDCRIVILGSQPEVPFGAANFDALNALQRSAAEELGAIFIPVYTSDADAPGGIATQIRLEAPTAEGGVPHLIGGGRFLGPSPYADDAALADGDMLGYAGVAQRTVDALRGARNLRPGRRAWPMEREFPNASSIAFPYVGGAGGVIGTWGDDGADDYAGAGLPASNWHFQPAIEVDIAGYHWFRLEFYGTVTFGTGSANNLIMGRALAFHTRLTPFVGGTPAYTAKACANIFKSLRNDTLTGRSGAWTFEVDVNARTVWISCVGAKTLRFRPYLAPASADSNLTSLGVKTGSRVVLHAK